MTLFTRFCEWCGEAEGSPWQTTACMFPAEITTPPQEVAA